MNCLQKTQWTVTDKIRGYSQDSEQSIILQGWQVTLVAAVTITTNLIFVQAEPRSEGRAKHAVMKESERCSEEFAF